MKNILIATRNKDKFVIVCNLLKSSIFSGYNYYSLADLDEEIQDKTETGDLINRSFEKAENVFNNIKNNNFDYIVGVDDGIKINGKMIESVKSVLKPIISGELLVEGEFVSIVRAYTFFNRYGKYYSILTDIPYKYKKLDYELIIRDNSFPLSNVLVPINNDVPVSSLSDEEANEYFLSYSLDGFKEVIKNLEER